MGASILRLSVLIHRATVPARLGFFRRRRMIAIGYIFIVVGMITAIVGCLQFLAVAYKRGVLWFLGCLFVPVVSWIFFFLNMKATIKPCALQIFGLLLAGIGFYMAGIVLHGS